MRRKDGTPVVNTDGAPKMSDGSYRLADGGGLFLYVTPSGKHWRLRYLHPTKRNAKGDRVEGLLSLGRYPEVDLAKARKRALEQRTLVADNVDPSQQRKLDRRGKLFRDVAAEWLALQQKALAPATYQRHVDVFDR